MYKGVFGKDKKFREMKNLTRHELADRLEMSVSEYGKLKRGEVEISILNYTASRTF